jgi:hypothetical protein
MTSFLDVKPEEIRNRRFRDLSLSGDASSGVPEIPTNLSSPGGETKSPVLVIVGSPEQLPSGEMPAGDETYPTTNRLGDIKSTQNGARNKTIYAKEIFPGNQTSPTSAKSPQHERPTEHLTPVGYLTTAGDLSSPRGETSPGDETDIDIQAAVSIPQHDFLPSHVDEDEESLENDTSLEMVPSFTQAMSLQPAVRPADNETPTSETSPRYERYIEHISSPRGDMSPGDVSPLGDETLLRKTSSNLIPGRGRSKVKRCILAQNGHSLGEEAVYQILWRTGKPETSDPNSSRTNRIGTAEIGAKVNMAKKNVRQNISRLYEKLAIEILEDFETMHSQARLYRVFSYKQILERRRAAGMEYVLRNKGVIFCTREGKEIVLPPRDETCPGGGKSPRPAPSKRWKMSSAMHRTSVPVDDHTDPEEELLVNSESPDLKIVIKALNKYWSIDQAAAVQLLRDCRRIRPDARAEEIAFFVEQKLQLARSNHNILNPTGLILSTVPLSFVGDSFEEFRRRIEHRAKLEAMEEERRRQEMEEMNRWFRKDRDKYQAIVNDLSKSQKERDEAEKRLREYANLDL